MAQHQDYGDYDYVMDKIEYQDDHHYTDYGDPRDSHYHGGHQGVDQHRGQHEDDPGQQGEDHQYHHRRQQESDFKRGYPGVHHYRGHGGGDHHSGQRAGPQHQEHKGINHQRGQYKNKFKRIPGEHYLENPGFTKDIFDFERHHSDLFETNIPGHIAPHNSHNHGKRQVLHGPNKHSLKLDKGFFDENFPGTADIFDENLFDQSGIKFQNGYKFNNNLNKNHHNPNILGQIQNNKLLNNRFRFKRNRHRNRFQGSKEQQFQDVNLESYETSDDQNTQNYGNNPQNILDHQPEDVLDKGPLLTELVFQQRHPSLQNIPPGQGLRFRHQGNRPRHRPRFKKNVGAGFLGLGNIVTVRWS